MFGAGTETTAATISFTLYALCMHAEIQEKVRSEVTNVIAKHGISYESLKEMSYLGMCISGENTFFQFPQPKPFYTIRSIYMQHFANKLQQ